jgi:hypothetical protein
MHNGLQLPSQEYISQWEAQFERHFEKLIQIENVRDLQT